MNSSVVECVVPPSDDFYGEALVEITLNGFDFYLCDSRFTYLPYPMITAVEPWYGPIEGGTVLTISGMYVDQIGGCCRFDGTEWTDTEYTILNESHIQCTTPKYWSKIVTVEISPNCREYTDHQYLFKYYTLPHLYSVTPSYVHADNVDMVILTGKYFGNYPEVWIKLTSITDSDDFMIITNTTIGGSGTEIGFIPPAHYPELCKYLYH